MAEALTQPVVIDNGTGIIKAGFAGAEKPKVSAATYMMCFVDDLQGRAGECWLQDGN